MGLSTASKSSGRAANQGIQAGAGNAHRSVSGHAQVARLNWFFWVKPLWGQEALTQIAGKDFDSLVQVAAKLALGGPRDGK